MASTAEVLDGSSRRSERQLIEGAVVLFEACDQENSSVSKGERKVVCFSVCAGSIKCLNLVTDSDNGKRLSTEAE